MRAGYVDQLVGMLDNRDNIRNLSVIAHVDHGKTTLVDSLLAKAGIMKEEDAGKRRMMDVKKEEQERGVTITATGISLSYEQNGKNYLVNLVDSPGHADFSSEVTAALRITDGALIVVDCVEGICVQTETVTRQALAELIKPVLHVNKVDRAISELQLPPEELYQRLNTIVHEVNGLLEKYESETLGELAVDPRKGTVSFGSGKQGWAFTLPLFAKKLSEKTGKDPQSILKHLWGDYFFDPASKRCIRNPVSPKTGEKLQRYVCQVLLKPLMAIFKAVREDDRPYLFDKILPALDITLTPSDKENLRGNDLLSKVLQHWLPAGDALVGMIVDHLPSPVQAQRYRVDSLYTGPKDDEVANAIRTCDPNGPLSIFISKMVPSNGEGDRFFAFGRVFSGTVRPQSEVYIMGPDYQQGVTSLSLKRIPRVVLMMGKYIENVESVSCGATVGLGGIDTFITKTGTLCSTPNCFPISPMKFSVAPVVRRSLIVNNTAHLPEFVKALRKLAKIDPCLLVITKESTGECIIAGAGELHIEVALSDLRQFLGDKVSFTTSDPIVEFRETISVPCMSGPTLARSPNRHNRLFVTAEPLPEDLVKAIDGGIFKHINGNSPSDLKEISTVLVQQFGWSKAEASRIWCFDGGNCLLDMTHGLQFMNEIRDHVVAAFSAVVAESIVAGEPLHGVRINLVDAMLHADTIHRGAGQIVPAAKKAIQGSILDSKPALLEPVFLAEIVTEQEVVSKIRALVIKLRGYVVDEYPREGTPLYIVKAHLPVLESFGFSADMQGATSGRAFPQLVFSHWQNLPGDPFASGSLAAKVVKEVRERKRLPGELPKLANYQEKM